MMRTIWVVTQRMHFLSKNLYGVVGREVVVDKRQPLAASYMRVDYRSASGGSRSAVCLRK
jgi:hypothetical protein